MDSVREGNRPASNGSLHIWSQPMRVGVFGTGHVGLPTAAALAHLGHKVVATDIDAEKVALLNSGVMPFFEPQLAQLVAEGLAARRLSFTTDPRGVIEDAHAVFVCVGTPPRMNGEANLLAVERAVETIAQHATKDLVIVEKSTVPAGTAARIEATLARLNGNVDFWVASNPEFLREGSAVEDSLHPARILVGSDATEALAVLRRLYAPLVDAGAVWIETGVRTAELAKHACNAFLATKISFVNAVARIAELSGADVVAIADTMGSDPRIGRAFLDAGLGYGGYCFPKDLAAFRQLATRLGYDFGLLDEVARINDEAVEACFWKVEELLWNLEGKRVALLGLAFKPGTDDVRFAPALALARRLLDAGAHVVGFDPQAGPAAHGELHELSVTDSIDGALSDAHCAVVCTEWPEIRAMDLVRARSLMAFPILVDGRNLFDPTAAAGAGFTYVAMGRPPLRADAGVP
jgi:UDPglucose 6-dehydrogenase